MREYQYVMCVCGCASVSIFGVLLLKTCIMSSLLFRLLIVLCANFTI